MRKENSLIKFTLDDGSTLLIEGVNDDNDMQRHLVTRGNNAPAITEAQKTLHQAIGTAKSAAELVLNSFKEMNAPDEINLQFGVKMAAKAGVIIASASSEANFQVSLKWKKKDE